MENNEIMVNEEVIENVTDVAEEVIAEPNKGFKTLIGVGLIALAGVVAFKIGKKIIANVKKAKEEAAESVEVEFEEVENDEESTEEV